MTGYQRLVKKIRNSRSKSIAPLEYNECNYQAFISYRHLDNKAAKWIQKKIESFKLPADFKKGDKFVNLSLDKRFPGYPVCRDEDSFGGGELSEKMRKSINNSRFFILICSENTKGNPKYVSEEIKMWCTNNGKISDYSSEESIRRQKAIIPVVLSSDGNFSDYYPDVLKDILSQSGVEPIALFLNSSHKNNEDTLLNIMTKLLDTEKDRLKDRVKIRKNNIKRMIVFSTMILLFAVLSLIHLSHKEPVVSANSLLAGTVLAEGTLFDLELYINDTYEEIGLTENDFIFEGFEGKVISINKNRVKILVEKTAEGSIPCSVLLKSNVLDSGDKFLPRKNKETTLFTFTSVAAEYAIFTALDGGFDKVTIGSTIDYVITFWSENPFEVSFHNNDAMILNGFKADHIITSSELDSCYPNEEGMYIKEYTITLINVQNADNSLYKTFEVAAGLAYNEAGVISEATQIYNGEKQKDFRIVSETQDYSIPQPVLTETEQLELGDGGSVVFYLTFETAAGEAVTHFQSNMTTEYIKLYGFVADITLRNMESGYWVLLSNIHGIDNQSDGFTIRIDEGAIETLNGRESISMIFALQMKILSDFSDTESPVSSIKLLNSNNQSEFFKYQPLTFVLEIEDNNTLPVFTESQISERIVLYGPNQMTISRLGVREADGWTENLRRFYITIDDEYVRESLLLFFDANTITDAYGNNCVGCYSDTIFVNMEDFNYNSKMVEKSNELQENTQIKFPENLHITDGGEFEFELIYTGPGKIYFFDIPFVSVGFKANYSVAEIAKNHFKVNVSNVKNTTGNTENKYILINGSLIVNVITDGIEYTVPIYYQENGSTPDFSIEPDGDAPYVEVYINDFLLTEDEKEIEISSNDVITLKSISAKNSQDDKLTLKYMLGAGEIVTSENLVTTISVPNNLHSFSLQVFIKDSDNRKLLQWTKYNFKVTD